METTKRTIAATAAVLLFMAVVLFAISDLLRFADWLLPSSTDMIYREPGPLATGNVTYTFDWLEPARLKP